MPSSNKFANVAPTCLLSLAITCGLFCLVVVGYILSFIDGQGFETIDYMISAEGFSAEGVGEPTTSPACYLRWAVGLSLLGAVASILGCIGSCECMGKEGRQPLLSTFCTSMLVLSFFFLFMATSVQSFTDTMVPILTRQTESMTSADVLPIFASRFSPACALPGRISPVDALNTPCGEDCQSRVALVRSMANRTDGPNSCAFLAILNQGYTYAPATAGRCTVEVQVAGVAVSSLPPLYTATLVPTVDGCKDACSAWTACSGISFGGPSGSALCHLVSNSDPDGLAADYTRIEGATMAIAPITGSDDQAGFECLKKAEPAVLTRVVADNATLWWLCIVGFVITLTSAILSAIIGFTVATKMQGKKGIHMVCARMYCGCCFPSRSSEKPRLANVETDGSDLEESEPLSR